MSDSSKNTLFFAAEGSFNAAIDAVQGNRLKLTPIYYVSEGLGHTNEIEESASIRGDRQVAQSPTVGYNGAGPVQTELQAEAYNAWLAALLSTTFVTGSSTVTVTVAGQVITATTGTFSTALQKARYVKITNAATAGNNGVKKVVSCTSTVLTLATGSLTGSDTGDEITVAYNYARNGLIMPSFLLEKKYTALQSGADRFIYFPGSSIDSATFNIAAKSRVTVDWNWFATRGYPWDESSGDGTPNALVDNPIITTNANIGTILVDGAALPFCLRTAPFTVVNNLRRRDCIGADVSDEYGQGDFKVTGTLEGYFKTIEAMEEVIARPDFTLEIPITDLDGRVMNFYFPRAKWQTGNVTNPGKNQDLMLPRGWMSHPGGTDLYSMQFDTLSPD